MSILREEKPIFGGLAVDETAKSYLHNTARWTKFLGIVYFIMTGIICVLFPFLVFETPAYNMLPDNTKMAMVITMIVLTLGLNFYPLLALIRFSAKIRPALQSDNQQQFNAALRTMKNMFKYIGILTIIFISVYGLLFVLALVANITDIQRAMN